MSTGIQEKEHQEIRVSHPGWAKHTLKNLLGPILLVVICAATLWKVPMTRGEYQ